MTRQRKIELIKKFRPSLYMRLTKEVPELVLNPNNASKGEIDVYNDLIKKEAAGEKNERFRQNFSFWYLLK